MTTGKPQLYLTWIVFKLPSCGQLVTSKVVHRPSSSVRRIKINGPRTVEDWARKCGPFHRLPKRDVSCWTLQETRGKGRRKCQAQRLGLPCGVGYQGCGEGPEKKEGKKRKWPKQGCRFHGRGSDGVCHLVMQRIEASPAMVETIKGCKGRRCGMGLGSSKLKTRHLQFLSGESLPASR
jgi:hypothetical protein